MLRPGAAEVRPRRCLKTWERLRLSVAVGGRLVVVREAAATSRDCSAPPRTPGGVEEPTPEGLAGSGGSARGYAGDPSEAAGSPTAPGGAEEVEGEA